MESDEHLQADPESAEDRLFQAIHTNDLDTATMLVTLGGVDINHSNHMSKTALYLAVEKENISMVNLLIENGVNVNMSSYCSTYCGYETPIVAAARLQNMTLVEILLQHDSIEVGQEGKTALQWAATFGNIPMAKLLVKGGSDIDWVGSYFHTALHHAAISDKTSMVAWLLEQGAEVNCLNGDGRSPLHIASVRGMLGIVRHLLSHNAQVDVKDNFGFSPFSLACLRGHLAILEHMTEVCSGSNSTLDLEDGLLKASESGQVSVLKYLLSKGAKVDARTPTDETALSLASANHYDAVLALLEAGACINTVNTRGYSPLQTAVLRNRIDIATILVINGADLHSASATVEGPLQMAFNMANPRFMKVLIQAGCSMSRELSFIQAVLPVVRSKIQRYNAQHSLSLGGQMIRDEEAGGGTTWTWIMNSFTQPQSLKHLCHATLRLQLVNASGGTTIVNRIGLLPLPTSLLSYTALDDISS